MREARDKIHTADREGTRRVPEPPAYWGDGREARQNRLTADGEVRT
jgi:hypothetical protein